MTAREFRLIFSSGLANPILKPRAKGPPYGLGIFIAQNFLERTGAELSFTNRPEGGAKVTVRWQRSAIEPVAAEEVRR